MSCSRFLIIEKHGPRNFRPILFMRLGRKAEAFTLSGIVRYVCHESQLK